MGGSIDVTTTTSEWNNCSWLDPHQPPELPDLDFQTLVHCLKLFFSLKDNYIWKYTNKYTR